MGADDKVVFLAYSNATVRPDSIVLGSCATCRNKTFTLLHDDEQSFPTLRCAACGQHHGRIGWASEGRA